MFTVGFRPKAALSSLLQYQPFQRMQTTQGYDIFVFRVPQPNNSVSSKTAEVLLVYALCFCRTVTCLAILLLHFANEYKVFPENFTGLRGSAGYRGDDGCYVSD